MVSGPAFAVGTSVGGRYRLDELLGRGGHAVVWGATHTVTGKRVALKIVEKPGPRGLIEARTASRLEHPNVIHIHDVFEDSGQLVIVMDWLVGESLAALLEREGPLPLERATTLMLPVLDAIAAAHRAGIVHRDLKPSNIFVVGAGTSDERLVLLDFGIAKALDGLLGETAHTESGAILGTPQYMAPEQLFGESTTDVRADLWSLGIVLAEVLSGKRPTDAPNVGGVLKRITTREIVPLRTLAPSLPAPLLDHVDTLLSFDAAKRPASVDATIQLLRDLRSGVVRSEPSGVARRRPWAPLMTFGLALVCLAMFVVVRLRPAIPESRTSTPPPPASSLAARDDLQTVDAGSIDVVLAPPVHSTEATAVASARPVAMPSPSPSPSPKATSRKQGIIQENPYRE